MLWYPKPDFWSQSWWVPLLFAGASIAVVAGAGLTRKLLRGAPVGKPTAGRLLGDLVAFVTAYVYTSYGHEKPDVVGGVLVGFWLARVLGSRPRWLIVYSILVGIGGTAFESFWSKLGFFYYHHPDFAGVPRWLPGIYLHVAFLGASLNRLVEGASEASDHR